MGKRPLVQSLSTLACFGERANYFRGELMATLKIVANGDIAADRLNGSWAGAFGQTQFMPSTFLRLAVDLDGDGRRDIVDSVPDALGSTANFLRKAGWRSGVPWGFEVKLPDGYSGPSGRRNKASMSAWAARGVTESTVADLAKAKRDFCARRPQWAGFSRHQQFRRHIFLQCRRIATRWPSPRSPIASRAGAHCNALADGQSRSFARRAARIAEAADQPRL